MAMRRCSDVRCGDGRRGGRERRGRRWTRWRGAGRPARAIRRTRPSWPPLLAAPAGRRVGREQHGGRRRNGGHCRRRRGRDGRRRCSRRRLRVRIERRDRFAGGNAAGLHRTARAGGRRGRHVGRGCGDRSRERVRRRLRQSLGRRDRRGAAGKVVDRFAPPVAAVPTGGLAMNGAQRSVGSSIGGVRQPCDSPGAGCRNTFGGARPPTPPANPRSFPASVRRAVGVPTRSRPRWTTRSSKSARDRVVALAAMRPSSSFGRCCGTGSGWRTVGTRSNRCGERWPQRISR